MMMMMMMMIDLCMQSMNIENSYYGNSERSRLKNMRNLTHCLSILALNLKHAIFKHELSQQNMKNKSGCECCNLAEMFKNIRQTAHAMNLQRFHQRKHAKCVSFSRPTIRNTERPHKFMLQ
jgi:hypothetical protein